MKVSLQVDLRMPHDGTGSLAEPQKMDRVLWKLYVIYYLAQGVLILALLWQRKKGCIRFNCAKNKV